MKRKASGKLSLILSAILLATKFGLLLMRVNEVIMKMGHLSDLNNK